MDRTAFCFVALWLAGIVGRSPRDVVRAVEERYRHATTLKATFYQRYSDGKGGGQAESGTVYFSRPGRMRWEYESPQQKLFLVDGKNVWLYIPADHAASRAKMRESSDWRTPLALLAGKTDLGKFCRNIELVDTAKVTAGSATSDMPNRVVLNLLSPADLLLRCRPRGPADSGGASDDAIRDVLFETDPEARLVRVLVRQAGSLETEFRFGHWQENIPVVESKFHFEPPPGTEIVDEDKLAGQIR